MTGETSESLECLCCVESVEFSVIAMIANAPLARFACRILPAILVLSTFSAQARANEPTRVSVCLRISKSGQLLKAEVYKTQIAFRGTEALAAVNRIKEFAPLPEGAPEYMDFHYDVVCGCTGYIIRDEMHLCRDMHTSAKPE